MKCLRCGRCCAFPVVIVKPEFVDIYDPVDPKTEWLTVKLDGETCPHLKWDGDTAICAIHDKEWFPETPCGMHTQIEEKVTDNCRTGEWIRKNNIPVKEKFYD